MKALSIVNPWAGLIATGVKSVENRTWEPPPSMIGQRFAIHASAKIDRETIDHLVDSGLDEHPLWRLKGAVLGVATLRDWCREGVTVGDHSTALIPVGQRRWWNGPVGFLLADVVALPRPVPCKGMLGFWTLPEPIAVEVMDQVVNR